MDKKKTLTERKREAILSAAEHCFREYGAKSCSMDDIAAVANVSKRTVYNHFESKEALLLHLLSQLWESSMINQHVEYDANADLYEQCVNLCLLEVNVVASQHYIELARVAYEYYMFKPEALPDELKALIAQETFVHRWIKAAMKAGKLKKGNVDEASAQIHSLMKGAGHWPQVLSLQPLLTEKERNDLAKRTADLFLSHYQK